MTMETNLKKFFADNNRSMMGGWTIQAREKAVEEALALKGDEKVEALLEIIERLSKDQDENWSKEK